MLVFNLTLHSIDRTSYQIYINKDGLPLSSDYIVEEGKNYEYDISYYYQYEYSSLFTVSNVLTDCEKKDNKYSCTSTTESVWFKFTNLNGIHSALVDKCDPIFQEKYADIMYADYIIFGYYHFIGYMIALEVRMFSDLLKNKLERYRVRR